MSLSLFGFVMSYVVIVVVCDVNKLIRVVFLNSSSDQLPSECSFSSLSPRVAASQKVCQKSTSISIHSPHLHSHKTYTQGDKSNPTLQADIYITHQLYIYNDCFAFIALFFSPFESL